MSEYKNIFMLGVGIGGMMATAIVGSIYKKHGEHQFVNGVKYGIALQKFYSVYDKIAHDQMKES